MPSIGALLAALDERTIARRIGIRHDETRMRYPLRSNTVASFGAFSRVIADYYNYHFRRCVSHGGMLTQVEAAARAKEVLEREYRRQGGDIVSAYNDAREGTNGGLRALLDKIAEALKAEAVERYIREVFDRQVAPNAWHDKVALIRQFIVRAGPQLRGSIHADQPERYAHNYQELVRAYVAALQRTSSVFRRL